MRKLRVGIFMGGNSVEREVSFNSGRTVYDHLNPQLYCPVPIFQTPCGALYLIAWKFMHRGKIADFEHRLSAESQRIAWSQLHEHIDIMFVSAHGAYGEDGRLQAMLTLLGIPYTGSKIYASALCMDKQEQKEVIRAHNIAVPHGIVYRPTTCATLTIEQLKHDLVTHKLALPLVAKPIFGGSSLGVHRITDIHDLLPAINAASTLTVPAQSVVVEEQLQGMEFSCSLLYDYANNQWMPLSLTEVVPHTTTGFLCYDQKYMPGSAIKYTPARCSAAVTNAIHATCIKLLTIMHVQTMARIDGFYTTDERIVIIDVNPVCGMDPASFLFREAAQLGLTHRAVINHIIATELHAYGMYNHIEMHKENMHTFQARKRVAVICGGTTHEREISLASGRNVIYKLPTDRYEVIPLFMASDTRLYHIDYQLLIKNRTAEIEAALTPAQLVNIDELPAVADFVFIALHGGCGENGILQGTLEMLAIPYNGSGVLTSARCMDKYITNTYLHNAGFDVPAAYRVTIADYQANAQVVCAQIMHQLAFPLIVKPHDDGCSTMVYKVSSLAELHEAIATIALDGKAYALVEEYLMGMELTIGCLGNDTVTVLPPTMVMRSDAILTVHEKFLPGAGENQTPAPLDAAATLFVQETIKDVYRTLNCRGYARIDCFYQSADISPTGAQRLVVLEINTLPGLTPATCLFHQAAEIGMRPAELLSTIIDLGFAEHAHTKQTITAQKPVTLAAITDIPQKQQ
jgi:D-alanine-D-alanine ligase